MSIGKCTLFAYFGVRTFYNSINLAYILWDMSEKFRFSNIFVEQRDKHLQSLNIDRIINISGILLCLMTNINKIIRLVNYH